MELPGGGSWLDLVQGGPGAFSFPQDAERAGSLGVVFPQGDYHPSRNQVESATWGAGNQLNDFVSVMEASGGPASATLPLPGAWQQQPNSNQAAPHAAGLGIPQYGLSRELLLFQQQQQQLLVAASQPPAASGAQQAHQPMLGLGLSMGMPFQQQPQQLQPQPQMLPQHQQQQQQQQQQQSSQRQLQQQQQQHIQQMPLAQMLPQQLLQQPQQQQQLFQLPAALAQHAVTTNGPGALGTLAFPAFGHMPPTGQLLQSQLVQSSLPGDTHFSSIAPAAASAAAAAGTAHDKQSKSRSSSAKRNVQVSAATGKPLTKSGDASRRYRERQRGLMASLEAELEGKMGQLQLLAAENEMLKLRAAVLESTVASREVAVQVTREHGPPVYDSASSLALSLSDDPHHEHSEGTDSGPLPQPGQHAAAAAEPAAPVKRCMSLRELHDLAALVPEVTAAAAAAAAPANSMDSSAHTTIAAGSGGGYYSSSSAARADAADSPTARSKSCPELIKEMTVEDIVQHYRLFVKELSDELVAIQQEKADAAHAAAHAAAAGAGTTAAAAWPGVAAAAVKPEDSGGFSSLSEQRLQQLTERCKYMFRMAATLNPAAYCQLFGRNLETGQPVPYDDAHWRQVIGRLGLSEQQARHITACSELYFPAVHQLQAERALLQQQLQASGPAQGMILNTDGFTPMQPVLDALATNLKKEHVMRAMLTGFVFGEVFSSLQKAKVIIFSAPVFPDMHAITCVMVKDALAQRAAQGLPPRFVFPHRHGPDGAQRVMEAAGLGPSMCQQQQQQQQVS